MAQQNSINNASTVLTIDNGASTDSYVQYAVSTTNKWALGVDFSASNSFKLSQGSALGTNDTFVVITTGETTMPLQSSFSVYANAQINDVTGDGTTYTTAYNTEIFDQNNNFSSNTFTAPVTGRYIIYINKTAAGITGSMTNGSLNIVSSNRTYSSDIFNYSIATVGATNNSGYTVIADMNAADTITATLIISNGSKVADFFGNSTMYSWLCGYLLC